ncbi:MAG: T9SS type A sorting domain-containing protein [Bacteroidia bacterium]|nr:T9SS type A sorting domain-containing protein [Bacteroidia bacterium]
MKKISTTLIGIALVTCTTVPTMAQNTEGTLTFSFTPAAHTGYAGAKHAMAVWIQTDSGTFVKTKLLRAGAGGGTDDHLPNYAVNAGGTAGDCLSSTNKTDAITGATLTSYSAKSITWDGKNVNGATNGTTVADGTYKVTIQETWNHGATGTTTRSFAFTKGINADVQTPTADANFTNISLNWQPTVFNAINTLNETNSVKIYPNPTIGVFNVSYPKANTIKVINTLGEIIITEEINQQVAGVKSIDLTNYANGIYVISVVSNEGTINNNVTLTK